ncbi:MAG: hypothetical protein IJT73_03200 [Selenomonadaceae bacterium]|nr:hypothetical protein [Selenomonadaceae bacterium]
MREASILFTIWGILIIFAGIYIYTGHSEIFPHRYSVKNNPAYLKYLGNKIIIVGFTIIFFSVILSLI